jgi:hypothetical protein
MLETDRTTISDPQARLAVLLAISGPTQLAKRQDRKALDGTGGCTASWSRFPTRSGSRNGLCTLPAD